MSKKTWYVDLPDPRNLDGEWISVFEAETKRECVRFCKKHGLDGMRPGVINLISVVE